LCSAARLETLTQPRLPGLAEHEDVGIGSDLPPTLMRQMAIWEGPSHRLCLLVKGPTESTLLRAPARNTDVSSWRSVRRGGCKEPDRQSSGLVYPGDLGPWFPRRARFAPPTATPAPHDSLPVAFDWIWLAHRSFFREVVTGSGSPVMRPKTLPDSQSHTGKTRKSLSHHWSAEPRDTPPKLRIARRPVPLRWRSRVAARRRGRGRAAPASATAETDYQGEANAARAVVVGCRNAGGPRGVEGAAREGWRPRHRTVRVSGAG